MSAEHDILEDYSDEELAQLLKEYEDFLREEGHFVSEQNNPLNEITYVSFTSRSKGKGRPRRATDVELLQTTDGAGMHVIKNDWAPHLDELAADIPGFEDNPTGLLEALRRKA